MGAQPYSGEALPLERMVKKKGPVEFQDLIYDVGLHQGEDSEFYLKKGFRVVAVEADPRLCEVARRRLRTWVAAGQLTILNVAVAPKDGTILFFANRSNSEWGTIRPEWASRNSRLGADSVEVQVDGVEFSQLLETYGVPYYLKIDIEGADHLCLEGLLSYAARPKYISLESSKTDWAVLLREFELLRTLGYSRFKIVRQTSVTRQKCPNPALEGAYIAHRFEAGSSGLFGAEAPGAWLCEREALDTYRRIFFKYRVFGDRGTLPLYPAIRAFLRRTAPGLEGHLRFGRGLRRFMPAVGWYDTHATFEFS